MSSRRANKGKKPAEDPFNRATRLMDESEVEAAGNAGAYSRATVLMTEEPVSSTPTPKPKKKLTKSQSTPTLNQSKKGGGGGSSRKAPATLGKTSTTSSLLTLKSPTSGGRSKGSSFHGTSSKKHSPRALPSSSFHASPRSPQNNNSIQPPLGNSWRSPKSSMMKSPRSPRTPQSGGSSHRRTGSTGSTNSTSSIISVSAASRRTVGTGKGESEARFNALFPNGPPSIGRKRGASFFNIGNLDIEDDDDDDDDDYIPLTSGGYGTGAEWKKKKKKRKKNARLGPLAALGRGGDDDDDDEDGQGWSSAPLPLDPDGRFWKQYQALRFLGNFPIVKRPPPHIPGTPVTVAFGPFLTKRKDRSFYMKSMQTTWLIYGRHKKYGYIVQHALRDASVTAREFDQMILAQYGRTIFGSSSSRSRVVGTPLLSQSEARRVAEDQKQSFSASMRSAVSLSHIPLDVNKHRGNADHEARVKIAANLVENARNMEIPVPRGVVAQKFYALQTWWLWRYFVLASILALMSLIQFEPPSTESTPSWAPLLEFGCLIVLWLDLVFRYFHIGIRIIASPWDALNFTLLFIICGDLMVNILGATDFRYSRSLPPLLLFSHVRPLQIALATVISALSSLTWILALVFFILFTFAIVGIRLFYEASSDGDPAFSSITATLLTLYSLIPNLDSQVTYSTVIPSPPFVLFYILFVFIVIYLMLSIIFATIFKSYRQAIFSDAINRRIQERRALAAAFALLDNQEGEKLGFMGWSTFLSLVQAVYVIPPPTAETRNIFKQIDHDSDGFVDVLEFFMLADILFLRFENGKLKKKETGRRRSPAAVLFRALFCFLTGPAWWQSLKKMWVRGSKARRLVRSSFWTILSASLVVANCAMAAAIHFQREEPLISPSLYWAASVVFVLLFMVEQVLKVLAFGYRLYWRDFVNRVELFIIGAAAGGVFTFLAYGDIFEDPNLAVGTARIGFLVSTLIVTRLFTVIPIFRDLSRVILKIGMSMITVLSVMFIVVYIYAVVGMQTFGGGLISTSWSSRPIPDTPVASFDSFSESLFTVLGMTTTSWSPLLGSSLAAVAASTEPEMESTVYWFFVSFSVVFSVLLLNLLIALVVEIYLMRTAIEATQPDPLLEVLDPDIKNLWGSAKKALRRPMPRLPDVPRDYTIEGDNVDDEPIPEKYVIIAQKYIRRWIAINTLNKRKDMVETRLAIASELLTTERSYVSALDRTVSFFQRPLSAVADVGNEILPPEQIPALFGSLEVILGYNKALLSDLEKRLFTWDVHAQMGGIFIKASAFLKTYTSYVNNYNKAIDVLTAAKAKNKKFREFLANAEREHGNGLTLEALLIQPVQRIPRYLLLLEDMYKNTWKEHPDYLPLKQAVKQISELADYINEKKREADSLARVHEIASTLTGMSSNFQLEVPHRLYICHGSLTEYEITAGDKKVSAPKARIVYLFSDILMVTTKKSRKKFKVKSVLSLKNLTVEDVADSPLRRNTIRVLHPQYKAYLCSRSDTAKTNWFRNINAMITQIEDQNDFT